MSHFSTIAALNFLSDVNTLFNIFNVYTISALIIMKMFRIVSSPTFVVWIGCCPFCETIIAICITAWMVLPHCINTVMNWFTGWYFVIYAKLLKTIFTKSWCIRILLIVMHRKVRAYIIGRVVPRNRMITSI
jgi:hypothetical protein